MNGWDFDGEQEISLKLERGASFGLSKPQYAGAAHVAMGALRMGGVEPCEIRLLPNGEPGADVILYGKNWVYTVRMQPLKERSSLFGLPLDSKLSGPGCELYVHEFREPDFVGDTLGTILRLEGIPVLTVDEYQEYLRREGVDY